MEYEAVVCRLNDVDYFEGDVTVSILGRSIKAYYQAPMQFALERLTPGAFVLVDLWHAYGKAIRIGNSPKALLVDPHSSRTTLRGQVVDVMSPTEFKVDCGFLVDVENLDELREISVGDFIETSAGFQVYFPGTEWER